MATDGRTSLSARVDDDVRERVDAYRESQGYNDRSEAVRDILDAGLREMEGPVSEHVRDMAFDAAYHLTLIAVVVVVLGFWPGVIGAVNAVMIALVVMTVAMAPVAALEVVRAIAGQSKVGEGLRGEQA